MRKAVCAYASQNLPRCHTPSALRGRVRALTPLDRGEKAHPLQQTDSSPRAICPRPRLRPRAAANSRCQGWRDSLRPSRILHAFLCFIFASLIGGCATTRATLTAEQEGHATVPNIANARVWADDGGALFNAAAFRPSASPDGHLRILALSGGGAEGAFGAGVLVGWTQSGLRPQFAVVTGSSIGGLIAPYAFLGPSYDGALERLFTDGGLENLLKVDGINMIFGSAVFKTAPLRELVMRNVDESLLAAIAAEHRHGRRLYVVTTNIDAQRAVIWNMGAIAASAEPGRLDLFRNILMATAAVPGMFSPGFIEVETEGRRFKEMHVDGGVTSNVLAVPEALLTNPAPVAGPPSQLFVIVNGKVAPDFAIIEDSMLPIVARSFYTTVKANMRNTLIATYAFTRRNGWGFNMTAIPQSEEISTTAIDFNTDYMRRLFSLGRQQTMGRRAWSHNLTDFDIASSLPRAGSAAR